MTEISVRRDLSALEIPMDAWTKPFWDGTKQGKILIPHCTDCGTFRWPPGPFCPACRSQNTGWQEAGQGYVYSFTIIRNAEGTSHVPALIEFPQAGGVRLISAIVDTPLDAIQIGAKVKQSWAAAGDAAVPVFEI
jgi:hypothetical protein